MTVASRPIGPDQLVGGKYRLVRPLAEGGMGAVWVAHHEQLGVDVALKLMSAEIVGAELALARFEREAKASAQLRSHHIVRVHDYGVDDGTPFIVMELLDGEDLGQRLKRDGPMTIAQLSPVVTQVCKALEVAREAGIVHRDLKPGNVFIAREGGEEVIKLVDFGVARETKSNLVDEKTSSGVVVGSPHHMSPEQAHGVVVDHRSDLWSLGVLCFQALTGNKPFSGDAMTAILLEVVAKPIPKVKSLRPELPDVIDDFMGRALSRDVERRFQRAKAMGAAFEAIAQGRDFTPHLSDDVALGDGREEATVPSASRSERLADEAPHERTGSREVGALTAGVIAAAGLDRRPRTWLWAIPILAVAVGAFLLGRSDGAPAVVAESAPDEAAAAPTQASVASELEPTASASASASAEADTSPAPALPPAPTLTPPVTHTAPPTRPPPTRTPPPPRIDPFTGLPATP